MDIFTYPLLSLVVLITGQPITLTILSVSAISYCVWRWRRNRVRIS